MTINTYLEATDDNSLQQFNFSQQGGSGGGLYQFGDNDDPVTDISDLQGAITDIIGYTNPNGSGSQKLNRILPATHPAFPYLIANALGGMEGKGSANAEQVPDVFPPVISQSEAIGDYNLYDRYQIKVNFATRNYTILTDSQISIKSSSWFNDSGSTVSFNYAPEWMRYTDWDILPQFQKIQGQQGALLFNSSGGPSAGSIFTSPPFIFLPDAILKFTWFEVPYRYITSPNSYIANRGWAGRINQNPWYNWPAGSLLFLSYSVRKYNPPNLNVQTVNDLNGNSWQSYAKLCDIEFTFLLTTRTISAAPSVAPTNKNWLALGHNLQPFLTNGQGFYYVETQTNPVALGTGPPVWMSFPLEALFSDPDVSGGP